LAHADEEELEMPVWNKKTEQGVRKGGRVTQVRAITCQRIVYKGGEFRQRKGRKRRWGIEKARSSDCQENKATLDKKRKDETKRSLRVARIEEQRYRREKIDHRRDKTKDGRKN